MTRLLKRLHRAATAALHLISRDERTAMLTAKAQAAAAGKSRPSRWNTMATGLPPSLRAGDGGVETSVRSRSRTQPGNTNAAAEGTASTKPGHRPSGRAHKSKRTPRGGKKNGPAARTRKSREHTSESSDAQHDGRPKQGQHGAVAASNEELGEAATNRKKKRKEKGNAGKNSRPEKRSRSPPHSARRRHVSRMNRHYASHTDKPAQPAQNACEEQRSNHSIATNPTHHADDTRGPISELAQIIRGARRSLMSHTKTPHKSIAWEPPSTEKARKLPRRRDWRDTAETH